MKTLIAMLALAATCVAADKAAPKSNPATVAKERQARYRLASDFRRVADKLSADEVKAVQAIVTKHAAKPAAAKPAPAAKHK